MKKWILYGFWVVQFILCAILGLLYNVNAAGQVLQTVLGILFFVPPTVLLIDAIRSKDRAELMRIMIISGVSLVATLVMLIANVLSVGASEAVGLAFHYILAVVSTPMFCVRYWIVSLFLWACLLMGTLYGKRQK